MSFFTTCVILATLYQLDLTASSTPCPAMPCTTHNINACWFHQNTHDYCKNQEERATCYSQIDKVCSPRLTDYLHTHVDVTRSRANKCVGMRDGDCFAKALAECMREMPIGRENGKSDAEKLEICHRLRGKPEEAKTCLNNLTTICTEYWHTEEIRVQRVKIEKFEMTCNTLNGHEPVMVGCGTENCQDEENLSQYTEA